MNLALSRPQAGSLHPTGNNLRPLSRTTAHDRAPSRLCSVHNQVNERLKKPQFDCAQLDETYDCGCGDTPIGNSKAESKTPQKDDPTVKHDENKDDLTGAGLIRGGR